MCWKHEGECGSDCFDYLFLPCCHESLFDILSQYYGVDIVDRFRLRKCIFDALTRAHKAGYIRPKTEKKGEG